MKGSFLGKRKLSFALLSIFLGGLLVITPSAKALEIVVSGNGSDSQSTVDSSVSQTTSVEQTNQASVENSVSLDSNTGGNEASGNTGEEVSIATGNIDTNLAVENALNNSSVETPCCETDTEVVIAGNGSGSTNTVDILNENSNEISVSQTGNIVNDIQGVANTGGNKANDNNANVSIDTGNIVVRGGVVNGPVNTVSVSSGAGSGVSLNISGNADSSQNIVLGSFINKSSVRTFFSANIINNIDWNLNTGRNEASGNNGDVSIRTGDIFFDFLIKNGPLNFGGIKTNCWVVQNSQYAD